ncbi:MAG: hypothetical protein QCI82_05535, partial [Candidatus Thermoplasmatota archaeon]|nr:hypothetical protein [Candidatus Thermoplasmatota archaeon]
TGSEGHRRIVLPEAIFGEDSLVDGMNPINPSSLRARMDIFRLIFLLQAILSTPYRKSYIESST